MEDLYKDFVKEFPKYSRKKKSERVPEIFFKESDKEVMKEFVENLPNESLQGFFQRHWGFT